MLPETIHPSHSRKRILDLDFGGGEAAHALELPGGLLLGVFDIVIEFVTLVSWTGFPRYIRELHFDARVLEISVRQDRSDTRVLRLRLW